MAGALPAVLLLLCTGQALGLVCRDEQGQEVDWWILYKLPKQSSAHHHVQGFLGEGLAYAFLTSALPDQSWSLSNLSIEDPQSMPGQV